MANESAFWHGFFRGLNQGWFFGVGFLLGVWVGHVCF